VFAAAGRAEESSAAFAQALERYERKQNLAMVAQAAARHEELRAIAAMDPAKR